MDADFRCEISQVELMALKKLALISRALGQSLSDKMAAKEQLALTSVLVDVIARAESSASRSQP